MIRFIFLLPIKIIGLLFMAIGALLDGANRRRTEQAKQEERQRREQYRIEQAAQREQERRERAARIATEKANRTARIEKEKQERERQRQRADTKVPVSPHLRVYSYFHILLQPVYKLKSTRHLS